MAISKGEQKGGIFGYYCLSSDVADLDARADKTPIEGGTRIVFAWTLDNGTVQTTSVDVMNGEQGVGVESLEIRNGHLFVTLSDGNELDAGAVPVSPGGEVAAITDAELEAMWGD